MYSSLAWKIPWIEDPGRLQSMESQRVRHDQVTSLSLFTFMHWRRKWQPTPVFLPGKSQGQGSLVGCRLWGRTESDMTEVTSQQQQQSRKQEELEIQNPGYSLFLNFIFASLLRLLIFFPSIHYLILHAHKNNIRRPKGLVAAPLDFILCSCNLSHTNFKFPD